VPSQNYGWVCTVYLRVFPTAETPSCTHTLLVVIVGSHAFDSRIHKVAVEPPNIKCLAGIMLFHYCSFSKTCNTKQKASSEKHCKSQAQI